jgi:hypothetical protein
MGEGGRHHFSGRFPVVFHAAQEGGSGDDDGARKEGPCFLLVAWRALLRHPRRRRSRLPALERNGEQRRRWFSYQMDPFSWQMGASVGASAISHLEEVSPAGVAAMAEAKVVAVILPTTAYILR